MIAQEKYGHINFNNLITQLPGIEAANEQMKQYQEQLLNERSAMVKVFQESVAALSNDLQKGIVSPAQQAIREKELQEERKKIEAFEAQIEQRMYDKRQMVLQPLIDQVTAAIDKVAKANGYVMVFDSGIFNAILFVDQTVDLMPLVKTELGIK